MNKEFKGLTAKEVEESRALHGTNALTQVEQDPLWKKILEGFKDPMIIILCVALIIQVIMFITGEASWYEPVCVLVAIMIANGVAAVSESKQQGKAAALKMAEQAKEKSKVLRDGHIVEIHTNDIVTGDIVYLQAGDKIPADGIIVDGELRVDQAALNGETEEAKKFVNKDNAEYDVKDLLTPFYVFRGTVACSGEAYMEAKVVGDKTMYGEMALEMQEDTRETPLQVKMGVLAKQISKFGYIGAVAIILGVMLRTFIAHEIPSDLITWTALILAAVKTAVGIIIAAVPEGLPMLTSILQAMNMGKMLNDNVLVRKLNGIETTGGLNILFSDKTGTITEGKLSVTELATGNVKKYSNINDTNPEMKLCIMAGIGLNNSAIVSEGAVIGGNSTDRALMSFLFSANVVGELVKDDVKNFNAFDSNKKYSSITISKGDKTTTYIKGAPEKIIERCTHYMNEDGEIKELVEKNFLDAYMNEQAGRSMRLLAVAMRDGDSDEGNLTLICVVSIRDNVRPEVIPAIKQVNSAGVQVVMVTGDRKETAVAIAKEAGLLVNKDDIAMTSTELSELSDDKLKKILPNLRVVARALPSDKSRLVRVAQELDLVVGMTGDGVNDSPALKKADVGFAMGSGTEVAKEAGDITILDDNFVSIGKAIKYGRTIFKSIKKFLIFQLTVNVAAVMTCFLSPLFGVNTVLTVVQLLFINLAMDTLAAIAFGAEPALDEYMTEKPIRRSENILSKSMMVEIITSAVYITVMCLAILFFKPIHDWFGDVDQTYLLSSVFAFFMMAITFNGLNARTTHMNVLNKISGNKTFLLVMGGLLVAQFIFVQFGGEVLSVEPLTLKTWGTLLVMAFLIVPIDMIRKLFVKEK